MTIISLPCGPFECHSDGTITHEGQPVNVNLSSKGYEYFCHKGSCYQVSDLICTAFHGIRPFTGYVEQPPCSSRGHSIHRYV
jgi:hypothetical protein